MLWEIFTEKSKTNLTGYIAPSETSANDPHTVVIIRSGRQCPAVFFICETIAAARSRACRIRADICKYCEAQTYQHYRQQNEFAA
jgi:hypothetical protein